MGSNMVKPNSGSNVKVIFMNKKKKLKLHKKHVMTSLCQFRYVFVRDFGGMHDGGQVIINTWLSRALLEQNAYIYKLCMILEFRIG